MHTYLTVDGHYWLPSTDGDERAFALMSRHYSFQKYADGRRNNPSNRNRNLFVGPGEKMVLLTLHCDALFVWRRFRSKDPTASDEDVNCAVFRNESKVKASTLIRDAEILAWERWPGARLYTYVDADKILSPIPGYCFKRAGWKVSGTTISKGLVILEKLPKVRTKIWHMPAAVPASQTLVLSPIATSSSAQSVLLT